MNDNKGLERLWDRVFVAQKMGEKKIVLKTSLTEKVKRIFRGMEHKIFTILLKIDNSFEKLKRK